MSLCIIQGAITYIYTYTRYFFQRRSVYLCLPRLVLSLYLWLYHPRSLPVNQGSRVVKEGGAAGAPWALQNDLRSLLIRRMTSRTRETDSVPLAMSPSLRHSVSTPHILVSACCGPEVILWIRRLGSHCAGLMAAMHPLPPSAILPYPGVRTLQIQIISSSMLFIRN